MTSNKKLIIAVTLSAACLSAAGFFYFDRQESADLIPAPVNLAQAGVVAPVTPLPINMQLDNRKVELGLRLFNDPKLSGDGTVSCAHCHNLATGGVDRQIHSRGVGGKEGVINAPTVFNSGFNFRQFWNGRAQTLEEQIDGPLQNPSEMNISWPQAITVLSANTQYLAKFNEIYPDGIKQSNVKDAIATFERSLVTPNSRFDRFLRGEKTVLNGEERSGYHLFQQLGCLSCHQGKNIGGNMYQKLGIMENYFAYRGNLTQVDLGRFNVTKQESDRYFFKVPSLRNVAVTPPYLHDGSAETLNDAVKIMARFQLGRKLDETQVRDIVAFLHTLTGEYMGKTLE